MFQSYLTKFYAAKLLFFAAVGNIVLKHDAQLLLSPWQYGPVIKVPEVSLHSMMQHIYNMVAVYAPCPLLYDVGALKHHFPDPNDIRRMIVDSQGIRN